MKIFWMQKKIEKIKGARRSIKNNKIFGKCDGEK